MGLGVGLDAADGGVRFVAADFIADQVGQLLLDAGLDPHLAALFLLEGAGHNHNVAVNRQLLWDRVARWATSVTS